MVQMKEQQKFPQKELQKKKKKKEEKNLPGKKFKVMIIKI